MERRPRFEFVRLLAVAAETGLMRWDTGEASDDVHACRATTDGRRYQFRHVWWYGEDGVTLDRQAAVIATDAVEVASTWGTMGHDQALRVLATFTAGWGEHVRELMDRVSPPEPSMIEPPSVSAKWQSLALAVRDASSGGCLRWERSAAPPHREEYVAYVTETGERFGLMEMLRPVDQDNQALGVMAARLSTTWGQAIFAAGTEGMELLREALAPSLPDWAAILGTEREALDAECRRLRALIG